MQKNIIFIISFLLSGCSTLPRTQGEDNQVVIFASPEDKLHIKPFIDKVFEKIIRTPQREPEIKIKWQSPWEIELYQYRPNLIIISLDYPADSTGDRLLQRFKSKQNQNKSLFIAENVFAQKQKVVSIHAQDAVQFQKIIGENGDWLRSEVDNAINENVWAHIQTKGQNTILQDRLMRQFRISAFIQEDYKLISESDKFIWLGRGYPYRWLTFLTTTKNDYYTVEGAWESISLNYKSLMPNINLIELLRSEELISLNGERIKIMRGVYEHLESDTGGPFAIYLFDGHVENEVILVGGFVNNPGNEKASLLRQLELTIKKMKFNRGKYE